MRAVRALRLVIMASLLMPGFIPNVSAQVHKITYDGFTIWVDCSLRGAIRFEYDASTDYGDHPRRNSFSPDQDFDKNCQQTSSLAYSGGPESFERGQLVPPRHLDHLRDGLHQSNFMTNVLPQRRNMNRGAWQLSEEIIDCWRGEGPLRVIGGVIYGRNPDDDYFIESHGVATADYFWKVIVAADGVVAWLIPNSKDARRGRLDQYLISIRDLERFANTQIDVLDSFKDDRPARSWKKPHSCDTS